MQRSLGLFTDTRPLSQPEGSYRYALNAVTETSKGDINSRSAESSNELCYSLTTGHILIGSINLDGNDKVIFSVHESNGLSEISLITNQCTRTSLILSDCLNFSILSHITGEYRLREGCKRTIYFRDDVNPPRIIDIDSLNNYKIDTSLGNISSNWNCNLMKWFPDYTIPQIDLNRVEDSGGSIPVGVVQFTVTYMDEDLNPVGYITPTNPIPIINQSEDEEDRLKEGGFNIEVFADNGFTNKSVVLDISNIDTQFKYIRLGALECYSGTGEVTRAILKPPVEITGQTMTLIYTGFNSNSDIITTEDEITQTRITYERFKDITQISNRMVAAGTESKNIDFAALQQMANQIQIKYVTKHRTATSGTQTAKTPKHYFYDLSLPRDEVVALAWVPIYTDGSEGPAFHIPGRLKDYYPDQATQINTSAIEAVDYVIKHRRPASTGITTGWDSAEYNPGVTDIYSPDIAHITNYNSNGYVERWQAYNTAFRESINPDNLNADLSFNVNASWATKGYMGYWESITDYPTITDCNGNPIYPTGKIRHHRIPDSAVEPHMGLNYGQQFATAMIIGLEVSNVNIPTSLQSEIQGWKIVRADYGSNDRTVIDRGIIYSNISAVNTETNEAIQYQTSGYSRHRWAGGYFPDGSTFLSTCNDYFPYLEGVNYNSGGVGEDRLFKAKAPLNARSYGTPYLNETKYISFHGPNSKFNNKELSADYIKFDLDLVGLVRWFDSAGGEGGGVDGEGAGGGTQPPAIWKYPDVVSDNFKAKAWCQYKKYEVPNDLQQDLFGNSVNYYNRKINNQYFVAPDTIGGVGILNRKVLNIKSQETYTIEANDPIPVSPKDQEWGEYANDGPNYWLLDEDWIWKTVGSGSDTTSVSLIGQSVAHYVNIKKYITNQFSDLSSIRYIDLNNTINTGTTATVWGGETHIALFESRKTDYFATCDGDPDGSGYYGYSFLVESTINTGLRNGGDLTLGYNGTDPVNDCEYGQVERYPAKHYYGGTGFGDLFTDTTFTGSTYTGYKYGNIYDKDTNGNYLSLNYCHHNFYKYNPDFSKPNNAKYYLSLEQSFDWCSNCQYKNPLMLAYSESSFQEETTDRYRVFRPNNYKLLPGHTGIIDNLFVKSNQLYVLTTQSLWVQPVNPQNIQTNENNLYIGTGEFFSLPPQEPVSKPSGYWGCQHKWSVVPTEFGVFWCDAKGGDVFLLSEGNPHINTGNNNFFKSNLKLQLPEQISKLNAGITLSENNSANPNGVGYTAVFDSKIDRYILTKKDYKLRDESTFVNFYVLTALILSNTATVGSVTLSPVDNKWYVYDGIRLTQIYLNNFTYFDNLSWTFSYSPVTKSWVSYHSYLPTHMYSDRNTFYSTLGSTVWKHDSTGFLSFYETQYPFIIDYIAEISPETKKFHNIEYLSTVEQYDSTHLDFTDKDETFTSVIAYNDTQSTGELTITPKVNPYTSITHTAGQCTADRGGHNRTWRINYLRDLVTTHNQPIFTKDQTQTNFQTAFPIDKVPNTNIINQGLDQYSQAALKDKYLGVRFKFLSTPDRKISFDLDSSTFSKELR